ncbi:GNAT family N-acetyltransferase [Nocardia aurea]|uniref:GNAT family N-acetyltransferase n=1 Tax=Nocardia aurea TaxID=2144174 RepID=UPI0033A22417
MNGVDDRDRVRYRRAHLADLESIERLENEVFSDTTYQYTILRQLFDLHGKQWLIAELDGEVIGHALMLEKAGRALLASLAVTAKCRSQGFGRSLLVKILEICVEANIDVVELTVRPTNEPARKLFSSLGFEVITHDDQYFGPDHPRFVMECVLAQWSGREG